jgi:hypothetical protein
MPMIGAAATAENVELVKLISQLAVLAPELHGVAVIEFFSLVELSVALDRSVGSETADSF